MTLSDPLQLVEPAYANFPAYTETLGPEVAELNEIAGFAPDAEQRLALDALFALGADGFKPSAFEFALIAARQNLKTGFLKQATLGWLFVADQRFIVWSAHEMDTTREAFRDLVDLIDNCPTLYKRLAPGPTNGIHRGNGTEAIELAPTEACPHGQRLKFKARTHSGGRGLSGDKVILDEAFALKKEHMGSLMPTLSTRREGQIVYGSSACRPESEVLRGIVERGRSTSFEKRKRLAYMEFCAPEDACEDPECLHYVGYPGCAMDKREYIVLANPQAGKRISWDYLEAERDALPPEEYGRERMGWHDQPALEDGPLISKDGWAARFDAQSTPGSQVAFGVYVNKLQTSAAIGIAGYREDGKIHVGIVPAVRGGQAASLAGIGWMPNRIKELKDSWNPCGWGVDDRSAAGSLLADMEQLGIEIDNATPADVARACGSFYSKFNDDELRHRGSKPLADSVTAGKMRDLADAWAWERKDIKSDIVQLMAVTLAVHALINGRVQETQVWGFYS